MALVAGDMIIPAGMFNAEAQVANLAVGSLCPEGLLLGIWTGEVSEAVVFNNGTTTGATALNPNNYRKCTPYSGTSFLGKTVRLNGACSAFRGVVVQELNTELDNTNGDGTQVPVVVVKTPHFTYVAEPGNISEVN